MPHPLPVSLLPQDFARSKLRLFVAAGLGLVALNAGSTAAFGWWYRKSGGQGRERG